MAFLHCARSPDVTKWFRGTTSGGVVKCRLFSRSCSSSPNPKSQLVRYPNRETMGNLPAFWTQACPEGMCTNGTQPVKVGHTTGVYYPYSFRIVMGVLLRPTRTNHWKSFSTKTRKSNHLQMSLQRQHFLLSYLKTLSVDPVGFEPATSCWAEQRSPNWANQAAIK